MRSSDCWSASLRVGPCSAIFFIFRSKHFPFLFFEIMHHCIVPSQHLNWSNQGKRCWPSSELMGAAHILLYGYALRWRFFFLVSFLRRPFYRTLVKRWKHFVGWMASSRIPLKRTILWSLKRWCIIIIHCESRAGPHPNNNVKCCTSKLWTKQQ